MSKRRADDAVLPRSGAMTGGSGGGRIDALGSSRNTNRDVAKWEKQCTSRLKMRGGKVLVKHITEEVEQPKDLDVPAAAMVVKNYLNTDQPIYAGASMTDERREKIDAITAMIERKRAKFTAAANKLFEAENEKATMMRQRLRHIDDLSTANGQANYMAACTEQSRKIAAKGKEVTSCIRKMKKINDKIAALKVDLDAVKTGDFDGESGDLRDNAYFKKVLDVCTSAKGTSPLAMKPAQFAAWASKTQQQALHEAREIAARQLLADNTIDSLHEQIAAMKDKRTAFEIIKHVRKTWCPLRKRDVTEIIQNFQAGKINGGGADDPGLADGQSYWEFIHKLDAEREYVAGIEADDAGVKDSIANATSEASVRAILLEAHTADHPHVETVKALGRQVETTDMSYELACQLFLDEEVKWQTTRQFRQAEDAANYGEDRDRRETRTCHNCGTPGHIAVNCPKPRGKGGGKGGGKGRGGGKGGKGRGKGNGGGKGESDQWCNFKICHDPDCTKKHDRNQHQPDAAKLKKLLDGARARAEKFKAKKQRKSQRDSEGENDDADGRREGTFTTMDDDYMTCDVEDDHDAATQRQPAAQTPYQQQQRRDETNSQPAWAQLNQRVWGDLLCRGARGGAQDESAMEPQNCAIDEGEQLMLTTNGHGKWICLDGGASRSTSNCPTDFLQMTNARGCVRTAAGTTLVQKGTIAFVVKATYQGRETFVTLVLPNKNKVKATDGDTTTRLLGEFDLRSMGFRDRGEQDDGRILWDHPEGYQIHAEFKNRIKSVQCEQIDNRANKLPAKLKKRLIELANAGGGFIIDPRQAIELEPPQPVHVTTRHGGGIDVPSAAQIDDSPPISPASRREEGESANRQFLDSMQMGNAAEDDDATMRESEDPERPAKSTIDVDDHGADDSSSPRSNGRILTDTALDEQHDHDAGESATDEIGKDDGESTTDHDHGAKKRTTGKKHGRGAPTNDGARTTNEVVKPSAATKSLKPRVKRRSEASRAKKWVTTFQILRRMMAPWKRLNLTVFGAPGFATLTKQELNTYFPKRCMKLGPRGIKAFFVGKPDLMSPTLWLAVEGKRWKVIRVSWTQWRAMEDDYITDERDKIVFPDGRQEDLEIVHGEHEARPPVDDADGQKTAGAPAGRPRGWTPASGLSYADFRKRQEIDAELSSDEDEVQVMTAPTEDAVHGQDHLLITRNFDVEEQRSLVSRGRMRTATGGRRHEPTIIAMTDDLHATTSGCWAEHVAQQIKNARPFVSESEKLTDRQRMQLPDPKNPVQVLLADDWAEMCLATQREVTGFKENAVFVVRRKADKYPKKLGRLLEIWTRKFEDGKFKRCKFRAVYDGRRQEPGVDCRPNVFWPTPASATIKLMFAWSATAMRRAAEAGRPKGHGKTRSSDLTTFFLQSPVDDEYGGHNTAIPGSFILAEGNVDEWAKERERLIGIRDGPDGERRLKEEVKKWSRLRNDEYYESQQMIYGDRAASARAGERLTGWVLSQGYTQSQVDPCFFFLAPKVMAPELIAALKDEVELQLKIARQGGGESQKRQKKRAVGLKKLIVPPLREVHKLVIHVDDLAHNGSEEDMTNFEQGLQKAFKVGAMGVCKSFNGMTVEQDAESCTVKLTQPNLLEKLESEHGHFWHDAKAPTSPLPPGTKLVDRASDNEYEAAKHLPFASIVSTLAYGARMTMLQIGLPVALLSRHMAKHNQEQFDLLVQCAHYAYLTRDIGITFCGYGNGSQDDLLTATADASFGDRSVFAHYLKMNGAAFDHSITSNKTAVLSTTEAELNSAARCGRAVMGYRHLLDEMPGHHRQDAATPVEGDCGPCITICNNPGALSEATRHMKRSAMYMRELVSQHLVAYTWTPTRFLQADAGTKVLTPMLQNQHLAELNGAAQATSWKRYRFHATQHKPYETMLARDEQLQRRKGESATTAQKSCNVGQKRKVDELSTGGKATSQAGGGKRARKEDGHRKQSEATVEAEPVNFVNFARLKSKEKSLLQAQILGFMSNAKLAIVQNCTRGFEYPGGIQNHSFLAQLRAGFPKKTQKNLRDDDELEGRKFEPCEHMCVDAFELSVLTIHGGRYVYVFTDAKCSKKRWALLARAKAHYPRVLIRLLGKVRALGWEVKCLRTDGAGEMVGEPARQVMDQHCIALEESSPHRPEENGTSERAVRAISEKARALMMNAPHLPASCGGLAVLHASALLEFQPFQVDEE